MNHELKTLQIKARQSVYTLLSGNNLSKLHGEGYDFSELREYQIGDDIRKINWTISAKLGTPYIKELHANRELSVVVSTLMDGSLYFADGNAKQKKITEVASIIAYATQHQNDLFTGVSYYQNNIYTTPPTKQIFNIESFSKQLFETPVLNTKIDHQKSIDNLFKQIHKPSLVFIISDFLDEVDLSLLAQKHEVIAIIIRDRSEENPIKLGETVLKSPMSGFTFDTFFGKRSINNYLKNLKEHDSKLLEHFSIYGVRYVKIFTDEEVVGKLLGLMR
ncbi:hypothetical protein MNB_SV-13-193 [hydrothermal vent metagenome]|uniref:DUF58 domain-containing protein n=1 Tax=hydrothermal vent metagenome TaxID=652676 RepID=A0A1W1BQZ4_9ZZZZ